MKYTDKCIAAIEEAVQQHCWRKDIGTLTPDSMADLLVMAADEFAWLPHGSGIDSKWGISKPNTQGSIRLYNSYHLMDEYGFYDGWQDFYLRVFRHPKTITRELHGPSCESDSSDSLRSVSYTSLTQGEGQTQVASQKGQWDWNLHFKGGLSKKNSAYGLRDYLETALHESMSPLMDYANQVHDQDGKLPMLVERVLRM